MLDTHIWRKLKRGPQVVSPKDAGAIVAQTGVRSGDSVIDAGTGSGWLAIFLGSVVAPGGKVISYENRPDFAELARGNVRRAGLDGVVEVKEKDAMHGFDEEGVDLITLDLADAEKALAHAEKALKMHGWIAGYFPNVEQVQRFAAEAARLKLRHARTVEVQEREWKIRSYGCRPENVGMQFTGFLCFLQKVGAAEFDREAEENGRRKAGRRDRRIREKLG
ncbi:MAG: methyltransferase domain-containing protein [Candidatus Micrarchaeota archaeon]